MLDVISRTSRRLGLMAGQAALNQQLICLNHLDQLLALVVDRGVKSSHPSRGAHSGMEKGPHRRLSCGKVGGADESIVLFARSAMATLGVLFMRSAAASQHGAPAGTQLAEDAVAWSCVHRLAALRLYIPQRVCCARHIIAFCVLSIC